MLSSTHGTDSALSEWHLWPYTISVSTPLSRNYTKTINKPQKAPALYFNNVKVSSQISTPKLSLV